MAKRAGEDVGVLMLRMPLDVKAFLEGQAKRNLSSQNSEVVRSVRLRMEAEARLEKAAAD